MSSFTFPFDAAHRALDAMDGLVVHLRMTVRVHEDALSVAHQDFEGETRASFDRDVSTALEELSMLGRLVSSDAEDLRATIAAARGLQAAEAAAAAGAPP